MPGFLRLSLLSLFTVLALTSAVAQQSPEPKQPPHPAPPATLADLQKRLTEHLSQPQYAAALWGVKIVSLDTGKTLFEHNPHKLFSPASNAKLYTVALALDRLGADYRIKTSLYASDKPNAEGLLQRDLIVYGRGDPTINARLHGGSLFRALQPLVAALTNAGVKHISGDLVGDASFFRGPEFGSGWAWDDLENAFGAELSALTIQDNTLLATVKPGQYCGEPGRIVLTPATGYLTVSNRTQTVEKGQRRNLSFYRPLEGNVVYVTGQVPLEDSGHTEEITLHNPAGLFLAYFKEALARQGIKVDGTLRTLNWLDRQVAPLDCTQLVELGAQESLPLREIVREVQKASQNLYTDLLLAHVGEKSRSADTRSNATSEELGILELNRFLARVGLKKGEVLFEEGSGLSRNNLTTPHATVTLLQHMSRHPCGQIYLEALPIAGVDGSLRDRLRGTPAAGNLRAKTGSLRWVNSLSGYVTTAAGERLAFSIMLNRYYNPSRSPWFDLDSIAVLLAGFTGRS